MMLNSIFYKKIDREFKVIVESEQASSGGSPLKTLQTKIFYLARHSFESIQEFDRALILEISTTLHSLEESIVKKAVAYKKLIQTDYKQVIDAQKWVDFAQKQATSLSYEMYPPEKVKYLRNLHIIWLTWIYCDEELKKLRVRSSRDAYYNLGKIERDYIQKRSKNLQVKVAKSFFDDDSED